MTSEKHTAGLLARMVGAPRLPNGRVGHGDGRRGGRARTRNRDHER